MPTTNETEKFKNAHIELLPPIAGFDITKPTQVWRGLKSIRNAVKEHQIDLLHIFFADPNAQWAAFQSLIGVPIVVTTRGSDVLVSMPITLAGETAARKISAAIYRRAFKNIAAVTSTSRQQYLGLKKLFGESLESNIIRTGVDVQAPNTPPPTDALPLPQKPFVLFPRLMSPVYNHGFALEGIAALDEKVRLEHAFVFLDANQGDAAYVADIRQRMGNIEGTEFVFLPRLNAPQLYECYRRASLIVMTPTSDGTPVSALEAMLFEKPLILPPLDYDSDLFSEGPLILFAWDATELAATMEAVLSGVLKPNLAGGRQRVLERGDRDKEMRKLEEVYASLVKRDA